MQDKIDTAKDEAIFTATTLDQVQSTLLQSFQKKDKTKKGKRELSRHGTIGHLGAAGSVLGAAGNVLKGHITKGFKKQAGQENQTALWSSPTTLGWLENCENERLSARGPETEVLMVWALVFTMPEDIDHTITDDDEGEAAADMKSHHPISHEAWLIAERLRACDFKIEHSMSLDGSQLILRVGAPRRYTSNPPCAVVYGSILRDCF